MTWPERNASADQHKSKVKRVQSYHAKHGFTITVVPNPVNFLYRNSQCRLTFSLTQMI